jgi:hypothetical protein
MYTETLTQGLSVADVVNTQSINNTNLNTIGVNMAVFKRLMYVVQAGSLGAAGTLDGRLQSCANSNFASNVHNITSSNFTQITANNALATVEVRADEVAQQNAGDQFVRLQLTGGGNAITVGAIGLAGDAVRKPGGSSVGPNDLNSTYLSQRVVV